MRMRVDKREALPPVVYIAGKFRADTTWERAENVREALRWALRVAEAGAMPLCPHANTELFFGQLTEEFWIPGTKALLAGCDASLFIPNWQLSEGARGEYDFCEQHEIVTFEAPDLLSGMVREWVRVRMAALERSELLVRLLEDLEKTVVSGSGESET